jgi:hypothetical protein
MKPSQDTLSYARLFWNWVWNEGYSYDGSRERLKAYGLSDTRVQTITRFAEIMADVWNTERSLLERAG